jgi:enoyl-CoA hydratase
VSGEPGVAVWRHGAAMHLCIERPESGNALMGRHLIALASSLRDAQRDAAVRAIVLYGAGSKFFCSGSDIAELAGGVADIGVHLGKWHELVDTLEASEKPVIAAINGMAVGGGLEIALACHVRIASETARFGLPELKVGLFPAAGGVRRLTRLIGSARALDIVLSADLLSAADARVLGIVDRVTPPERLQAEVERVAERVTAYEPNAVRATLVCARTAALGTDTNELERSLLRECYANARNREVLQSFMSRPRATPASNKKESAT